MDNSVQLLGEIIGFGISSIISPIITIIAILLLPNKKSVFNFKIVMIVGQVLVFLIPTLVYIYSRASSEFSIYNHIIYKVLLFATSYLFPIGFLLYANTLRKQPKNNLEIDEIGKM